MGGCDKLPILGLFSYWRRVATQIHNYRDCVYIYQHTSPCKSFSSECYGGDTPTICPGQLHTSYSCHITMFKESVDRDWYLRLAPVWSLNSNRSAPVSHSSVLPSPADVKTQWSIQFLESHQRMECGRQFEPTTIRLGLLTPRETILKRAHFSHHSQISHDL